jgi:hypothetical protein
MSAILNPIAQAPIQKKIIVNAYHGLAYQHPSSKTTYFVARIGTASSYFDVDKNVWYHTGLVSAVKGSSIPKKTDHQVRVGFVSPLLQPCFGLPLGLGCDEAGYMRLRHIRDVLKCLERQ